LKQKPGLEARRVAAILLTRVMDDARNLDALCDRNHGLDRFLKLEARDQALARAIAVTGLRHHNRIEAALKRVMDRPPPKKARHLIHSLHVAATQILFMDSPDSAAVNLGVTAIGDDDRTARFRSLANAVLRRLVKEKECLLEKTSDISCIPNWLSKALRKDYGKEKAGKISGYVTMEPMIDLTVKSENSKWAEKLDAIVLPTGSIRLTHSKSVPELEGYEAGEWWVQDAAAALPARLIKAKPGMRVLELCAAPGGKTAQLANSGYDVTAVDISQPRLKRLEQNLDRLGLSASLVASDILEYEPEELFDAILLDAPCSSTGTVRRHPDVLWTKTSQDITALAKLQYQLLEKARSFLKPGGFLVFSNCSMLKEEGEDVFSMADKNFDDLAKDPILAEEINGLETCINGQGALRTLPFHLENAENKQLGGLDGFFACRFIKR
jgi:16S rRNA (cytosine967-C5)-methyltransferase